MIFCMAHIFYIFIYFFCHFVDLNLNAKICDFNLSLVLEKNLIDMEDLSLVNKNVLINQLPFESIQLINQLIKAKQWLLKSQKSLFKGPKH